MNQMPINVIIHNNEVYVNVVEFVAMIVQDLQQAPPEMVASRDDIIAAMRTYAEAATKTLED